MIITTHRSSMLALVDQVIVIEQGRVALDGPKDEVLAKLPKTSRTPGSVRTRIRPASRGKGRKGT